MGLKSRENLSTKLYINGTSNLWKLQVDTEQKLGVGVVSCITGCGGKVALGHAAHLINKWLRGILPAFCMRRETAWSCGQVAEQ